MKLPSISTIGTTLRVNHGCATLIRGILWAVENNEELPDFPGKPRGTNTEKGLEYINHFLGGYGVESIRDGNMWENYWTDHCAMYVNMSETYSRTILYETESGRFVFTSWGQWVEENEKKRNFNP